MNSPQFTKSAKSTLKRRLCNVMFAESGDIDETIKRGLEAVAAFAVINRRGGDFGDLSKTKMLEHLEACIDLTWEKK